MIRNVVMHKSHKKLCNYNYSLALYINVNVNVNHQFMHRVMKQLYCAVCTHAK